MVSEYLKHTRTLEELDTFFEKARKTSVESAEIVFSQDVAAALGAVADIHEVADARIMADTRVASAKLASSAEVYSTALLATAVTLRLAIQKHELSSPDNSEIDNSIVTEQARGAEEEMKSSARLAIEKIESEARVAISKISENTQESIADIKKIAQDIHVQIDGNAAIARTKLWNEKNVTDCGRSY